MFGKADRAIALARLAMEKADAAANMMGVISEKLAGHMNGCTIASQRLADDLRDMRSDSEHWRAGLGQRLDRQDRLLWSGLAGVLTVLLTCLGFLVVHFVIK
ncbi:MAG: hypothetical protein WAN65_18565 [Candidatus Sulfotelmatobacter sp.]